MKKTKYLNRKFMKKIILLAILNLFSILCQCKAQEKEGEAQTPADTIMIVDYGEETDSLLRLKIEELRRTGLETYAYNPGLIKHLREYDSNQTKQVLLNRRINVYMNSLEGSKKKRDLRKKLKETGYAFLGVFLAGAFITSILIK